MFIVHRNPVYPIVVWGKEGEQINMAADGKEIKLLCAFLININLNTF